jgi:hypothetical protein
MGSRCEWFCWEIMRCRNSDACPAKQNPQIPCWEIARESASYKHALNICLDCIVYLLKNGGTKLSNQEIKEILKDRKENHSPLL